MTRNSNGTWKLLTCAECGRSGPIIEFRVRHKEYWYDTNPLPGKFWVGNSIYCPDCGAEVEKIRWGKGKEVFTPSVEKSVETILRKSLVKDVVNRWLETYPEDQFEPDIAAAVLDEKLLEFVKEARERICLFDFYSDLYRDLIGTEEGANINALFRQILCDILHEHFTQVQRNEADWEGVLH